MYETMHTSMTNPSFTKIEDEMRSHDENGTLKIIK
jgi:hypothetical protein